MFVARCSLHLNQPISMALFLFRCDQNKRIIYYDGEQLKGPLRTQMGDIIVERSVAADRDREMRRHAVKSKD